MMPAKGLTYTKRKKKPSDRMIRGQAGGRRLFGLNDWGLGTGAGGRFGVG